MDNAKERLNVWLRHLVAISISYIGETKGPFDVKIKEHRGNKTRGETKKSSLNLSKLASLG